MDSRSIRSSTHLGEHFVGRAAQKIGRGVEVICLTLSRRSVIVMTCADSDSVAVGSGMQ